MRNHYLNLLAAVSLSILLISPISGYGQCGTPTSVQSKSGCPGVYTLLVVSLNTSVTSVKWYTSPTGSGTITPTTNGSVDGTWQSSYTNSFNFSVTYYVALVCGSSEGPRVPISFTNTASSIGLSASSDPMAVSPGSNFFLTASGGTYQWRYGNNSSGVISTSSIIYPSKGGIYYLNGHNTCGTLQTLEEQVNFLPSSDAGLDQTISSGTTSYSVYGSGSDQDEDAVTFSWTKISGPSVTLEGTSSSVLGLSGLTTGTYVFRLTVTDVHGKSDTDDVEIEVQPISNNNNYVKEENVFVPNQLTNAQVASLTVDSKGVSYNYLNGLGNPIQIVDWQSSPSKNDIIIPHEYDDLMRAVKKYLPIQHSQNTGVFAPNILGSGVYTGSVHYNFYNPGIAGIPTDTKPYRDIDFESSPLARVTKTGSTGAEFQPGENDIETSYTTNGTGDIRRWSINSNLPVSSSTWDANTLQVVTITNAHGIQSQEITNREGLILVDRRKIDATNWAETYYVYDERSNLRFVLPPELMRIIKTGSFRNPTQTEVDALAFQHIYDDEKRLVESKSPGTGWVFSVYDKRHRLVLLQDAKQRTLNEWSYTKYDEVNRPVISGIYQPGSTVSRASMQASVYGLSGSQGYQSIMPPRVVSGVKVGVDLVISSYEGINEYNAINSVVIKPGFTFTAGTTASSFIARIDDGTGVTADVFPATGDEALVMGFYDSYENCGICQDASYQFIGETFVTSSNEPFAKFSRLSGQLVATSTKVLNSTEWIHVLNYFNRHGEVIQNVSTNHRGGVIRMSNLFDFSGILLESVNETDGNRIVRRIEYDHAGRVIRRYYRFNSQPEVVLAKYDRNSLGQLIDKSIHSDDQGNSWLQSLDYEYTIRGQLDRLNDISGTSGETDYFGLGFAYSTTIAGAGNDPRYDGNISATQWSQDLSGKTHLYNFSYDQLMQLTDGVYKKNESGVWVDADYFSENAVQYDLNGNITRLKRYSEEESSAALIDDLVYDYGSGGNQLMHVTDNGTASIEHKGFNDGNTSGNDYSYDVNGNMTFDKNKDMTIAYNHLNLPDKITFADNSYLQYAYDAAGTKLSQSYYDGNNELVLKTDYSGEFVYLDDIPALIHHEEGRLVPPSFHNLIDNREANSTEGYTASGSVTLSSVSQNGQSYVKAVCSQSTGTPGVYPIGGTISVKADEKYSFKILGYRETTHDANLYIWGNSGDIVWTGPLLAEGLSNETWVTSEFTIPSGVTQIKVGVLWSAPVSGATLYINRAALYKLDWEYQYFIRDHLGSPRVVLQTEGATLGYTATMESENLADESGKFLNIDSDFIETNPVANATPGGNEVIRMTSAYRIGPLRSMKVYPGDVIDAQVSAYYPSASGLSAVNRATMASTLISLLTGESQAIADGVNAAYNSSGNPNIVLAPNQGASKPSAFLNYILFDEAYQVLKAESAALGGANSLHVIAIPQVEVKEVGTLLVYLSYDNDNTNPVYFDELKIIHQESPVIQVNAYYPYGMTAYSWVREGENENKYLYQGKELESLTGWHDFHARQYDAALGRWFAADPAGQFASPYLFGFNNPVMTVDPDGELAWFVPIIVGAVIGGTSGAIHASNDPSMSIGGGIWRGALIGAGAGGAGVSVLGGGAMLAGAAGGAIAGAGFSGMATGWDGQAMLRGGLIGAASGFFGGGVASAIGGGTGALFGGITSDITSQLLSTGDVNLLQAGVVGGMSFGMYQGMSYLSYKFGGDKIYLGRKLTYRQFAKMNTAYQRSRFWGKEHGAYLNNDGSARLVPRNDRHKFSVTFDDFQRGDFGTYHTHWAKPDVDWANIGGTGQWRRYDPTYNYPQGSIKITTTGAMHSPGDISGLIGFSYVAGRTGAYYYNPGMSAPQSLSPDPFVRFFMFPGWWR